MARHTDGPRLDRDSGLIVGEIELVGGLPPEEPDDVSWRDVRDDYDPALVDEYLSRAGDAPALDEPEVE